MQLSTWDKEELDEKLANRVQVSKRAVAKIIQVYDRLLLKYEKMLNFLESLPNFNTGKYRDLWLCSNWYSSKSILSVFCISRSH